MYGIVRKVAISGLSIVLLGGMITPTLAQAATTSTSSTTSDTSSAYTIGAVGSPYSLITTATGTNKLYWFSDTDYAATQLTASDFASTFASDYSATDDNASYIAAAMTKLAQNPIQLTSGETLYAFANKNNWGLAASSDDEAAELAQLKNGMYFAIWTIKVAAAYQLGTTDFDTIASTYQNTIRPRLLTTFEASGLSTTALDQTMAIYDANFDDESTFKTNLSAFLAQATELHLGSYTTTQLSELNPTTSAEKYVAAWETPMTDLLTKESDGTYRADGLIIATIENLGVFSFVDDATTTSTTSAVSSVVQPVTVHYVDSAGQTIKADTTLTGLAGASYETTAPTIAGYTLTKTTGNPTGTFSTTAQSVTYTYTKTQSSAAATTATTGTVIYATKKLGLYKSTTFSKHTRKQWYAKKSRLNRPLFKITGTATNKAGITRYQVTDINKQSTTYRQTGYITSKGAYTQAAYYTTAPAKVTVLATNGINGYAKSSLTGSHTHYRQGKVLTVKKVVTTGNTTRLLLTNGNYITANKKLVQAGTHTLPTQVRAKTALNRYATANLTKRNRHYTKASHHRFTVTGWAYSNTNNFSKGDTLRYKVAGGYITANAKYVQIVK